MKKKLSQVGIAIVAVIFIYFFYDPAKGAQSINGDQGIDSVAGINHEENSNSNEILLAAYEGKNSDIQVVGIGKVVRILPDDNEGSRHQKFILQLASGQQLLIAHNIDLAPRIDSLKVGDVVGFNGEYEWNAKGGVVHWTHKDPNHRHEHGWLKHNNRTYQ